MLLWKYMLWLHTFNAGRLCAECGARAHARLHQTDGEEFDEDAAEAPDVIRWQYEQRAALKENLLY